ncbi:hypothetical protein LSH36_310g02060 [Paralvinella palmiformis]|uniref:LIM zinc-binding domain-containing protein n=1 Tax=Paralvinella palmiformis TaxID=53620 RepID=A0AAD9JHE9_9ANNE|nr:hypothetical protein LSH36_310g02060 [Paralvinella palmiformis]
MGKLSFGTTGISYQPDKVELKVGGAPKCPRCSDRVYFNEEKKALGKSWHSRCFTCANCKKGLDSTNCAGHDNQIYCVRCHRKEFGPKGYGFAGGMAGLSTESTYHNVRPVSPINTQTVPQHIPSKTIERENPECCPRCGKRVYFAEEVKALRRKWHKLCFKCVKCSKILEPSRCNEHNREVYCQSCYGRMFGPSGYGYAGGAGTMLSSETVKPLSNRTNMTNGVAVKTEVVSSIAGSHEWTEGVQKPNSSVPLRADIRSPMAGSHEWTEGVLI